MLSLIVILDGIEGDISQSIGLPDVFIWSLLMIVVDVRKVEHLCVDGL